MKSAEEHKAVPDAGRESETQHASVADRQSAFGRRKLLKLGAGVVATALGTPKLVAQAPAAQKPEDFTWPLRIATRAGYKNNYKRLDGNGPMDDTTRQIVEWVHAFDPAKLTDVQIKACNKTMLDTIAAMIAGFEEKPIRICARLAADAPLASNAPLKATVMGYGITTTPELATFANSAMVRMEDYNDHGPGGHNSDVIPVALAIGEALHCTGLEVMAAIAVAYEIKAIPAGGEQVGAAMAAGKLMKLNPDELANALTLALTPHVNLNKGVGAMSMWKGVRSAEHMKCGVWGALMARRGMTGPPQPYEGKGGRFAVLGKTPDVKLPIAPKLVIERMGFKRFPAEASCQGPLELIPEIRAWAKPDEIDQIYYGVATGAWEEIADAPKWDSQNRETADHSIPWVMSRALLDGSIYMDSYTEEKMHDPAVIALVNKTTVYPNENWPGQGPMHIVIFKKNGEKREWDALNGRRDMMINDAPGGPQTAFNTMMTDQEITDKFNRACAYHKVANDQRDRARTLWGNLHTVKDIGEAIASLAKYGNPKPL